MANGDFNEDIPKYKAATGKRIANEIKEGTRLVTILRDEGITKNVYEYWKKTVPAFNKLVEAAVGRKSARYNKYSAALCEKLIKSATQGESVAEFCANNKLSERTYRDWQENREEFKNAIEIANVIREANYAATVRELSRLPPKECNARLVEWYGQHVIGWRPKQEVEHKGQVDLGAGIEKGKKRVEDMRSRVIEGEVGNKPRLVPVKK